MKEWMKNLLVGCLISRRNILARLRCFMISVLFLQILKLPCLLRVREKEPEKETGKQERSESTDTGFLFHYDVKH